jgi:hypothetical protein
MKNTLLSFLICFISINSYAQTYTKSYCESKAYWSKWDELLKSATIAYKVRDYMGACRYQQQYIEHSERCKSFWNDADKKWIDYVYSNASRDCGCANNPNKNGC